MITYRSTLSIVLIIILAFFILIAVPITILFDNFLNYGKIEESLNFYYSPEVPSLTDKLYINTDVGNIEIMYATKPTEYPVSIEVNINIGGSNLADKSYLDYFDIAWNETLTPASFNITIKSSKLLEAAKWFSRDIEINVILKKEIVFDIITNLVRGNFEITVPWAVSIGNLSTNVSNGNILYNFVYSSIQGNITGNINEGEIMFKSFDVEYAHNTSWDLNIGKGNIIIEIYQNRDMGVNITSIVKVNDGEVFILYEDNSADIGAILEIPYGDPFMSRVGFPECITNPWDIECTEVEGFDYDSIDVSSEEGIVYFISFDLLANIVKNYYSMRFEIIQGSFAMSLLSEPKY